jgi:hypothetical protein
MKHPLATNTSPFLEPLSNVDLWISIEKKKRKWEEYEHNRVFQDVWNPKLPWVKLVVDVHWNVHQFKHKICTKRKGKEKLLTPKLYSLWIHDGRKKIS